MKEFIDPEEFFLKIDKNDYILGRIIIHSTFQEDGTKLYNSEIDIVQRETKKIWHHIGFIFGISSREEAIDRAVQKMADFLKEETSRWP
jgi:hypothetical protein